MGGLKDRAKELFTGSAAHRLFHDLQVPRVRARVMATPTGSGTRSQAACISPYKSGTTYFGQLFPGQRVGHEPLHAPTLRLIDDDAFLARRWDYLDLDLECSGFLSLRAEAIMAADPDRAFVMLARPPLKWARSVLDYFSTDAFQGLRYNYIGHYFFDRIGVHDIASYRRAPAGAQQAMYEALFAFWTDLYGAGQAAPNCLVVRLDGLRAAGAEIEAHLGLAPVFRADVWQRKGVSRTDPVAVAPSAAQKAAEALYATL
jgi:hypothetical protein